MRDDTTDTPRRCYIAIYDKGRGCLLFIIYA